MNDWNENFPGPGAYHPEHVAAVYHKAAAFSISGRSPVIDHKQVPGPAYYSPKTSCHTNKAPAYSMRPKFDEKNDTSQPGPNAYNPRYRSLSGSVNSGEFTLHGRDTPDHLNKNPGPGAYDTEKHLSLGGSNSRRSSISGRNDDCLVPKAVIANPSPAEYSTKNSLTSYRSPAFSLSSRLHENMNEALGKPGPGQYSPSSRSSSTGRQGFSLSGRVKKAHVPE